MKCDDDHAMHGQEERTTLVDDACIEAADEIMYKLSTLKRERTTLVSLVQERIQAGLPLNSPALLAQAEKINALLGDEAIRELFLFLRTSTWMQNRLNAKEFKQPMLVLASLSQREAQWMPLAQEEFRMLHEEPIQRLLNAINQ